MESELELNKDEAHDTDGGFSEKKIARRFDRGIASQNTAQNFSVFAPPKKGQTLFQAHKDEEI